MSQNTPDSVDARPGVEERVVRPLRKSIFLFLKWIRWPLLSASLLLSLLGFAGYLEFGSLNASLAYLQGQSVFVDSPHRNVGEVSPGETREIRFHLKSLVSRPITIIGVETSCGCAVPADQLPMELAGGEEKELTLMLVTSRAMAGSSFFYTAGVFLDDPGSSLTVSFDGTVAKK